VARRLHLALGVKAVARWWSNPRIPISPVWRLRLAWIVVVVSSVGWPLSALTFAQDEPQFVLGLSWMAITITALDVLATSDVRAEQDEDESSGR
jgi:hypothetical protein